MRDQSLSPSPSLSPPTPSLYIYVSVYIVCTYTFVYSDTHTYTLWVPFLWRTLASNTSSTAPEPRPAIPRTPPPAALGTPFLCSPAFLAPQAPPHPRTSAHHVSLGRLGPGDWTPAYPLFPSTSARGPATCTPHGAAPGPLPGHHERT